MLHTILYIALFWAVFFVITKTVHYFYMDKGFSINAWSYFDAYPWICYKCMCTQSLIAGYIMMAFILQNWYFGIFGVLLGGAYGFGLYKLEKERIITEEDEKEQKPIGFTAMAEISPVETYEEYEDEYDTEIYAKKVGNKKKK